MAEDAKVAGNDQQKAGEDQQQNKPNEAEELKTQLQEIEAARKEDQRYMTQLQQQLADKADEPAAPDNPDPQLEEARKVLEQMGYVNKDSVKELLNQELTQRDGQRQIADAVKTLSSKFDGKGEFEDYPTFNEEEVLEYAQEKNIYDLEQAYRSLHNDKIMAVEVDKAVAKANKKSATPDRSDAPRTEPVDKDTIAQKLSKDVVSDPTKLAEALTDLGMGSLPRE